MFFLSITKIKDCNTGYGALLGKNFTGLLSGTEQFGIFGVSKSRSRYGAFKILTPGLCPGFSQPDPGEFVKL